MCSVVPLVKEYVFELNISVINQGMYMQLIKDLDRVSLSICEMTSIYALCITPQRIRQMTASGVARWHRPQSVDPICL